MNDSSENYSHYDSGRSHRYRDRSREREDRNYYRENRSRPETDFRNRGSQNYSSNARSRSCSPVRYQSYKDDYYQSRRYSRRAAARESNIILVRGIPRRFTEQQLTAAVIQTTTIYEQLTLFQSADNNSRNSAVLRFSTIQEAQDFISSHPRGLSIGNYHATIYFGTGYDEGFWSCVECYVVNHESRSYCLQCGVLNKGGRDPQADLSGNINNGERDIGYEPSHILLIRGLDTLITEEEIFNCASKITSVYRIWLVKDRLSKVSCGFGFLELSSLSAAIDLINSLSGYYEKKTSLMIGSRIVIPCFAHSQSIIPAPEPSDWTVWGTDNVPYQYWDENLYVSEFPEIAPPSAEIIPASITTQGLPSNVSFSRPVDLNAELEAFDAFLEEVTDNTLVSKPEVRSELISRLPHVQNAAQFQYFAAPSLNFDIERLNSLPTPNTSSASKSISEELEVKNTVFLSNSDVTHKDDSSTPTSIEEKSQASNENNSAQLHQDLSESELDDIFLDYSKFMCRLCLRQFRESKDLDKHKNLSNLHKSNLKDSLLVSKTIKTLESSKKSQYRDRAKERRKQSAQEKSSAPQNKVEHEPSSFIEETPPVSNVASRLMSKMGWKQGQGLGKDGTGIREPIQGKIYAKGAGIGSSELRTIDSEANEKYHDRVKRTSYARYQEDY